MVSKFPHRQIDGGRPYLAFLPCISFGNPSEAFVLLLLKLPKPSLLLILLFCDHCLAAGRKLLVNIMRSAYS